MGGTFNPIHHGHLAAAESVRHEFELDEILFVPSGQPPHKNKEQIVPPNHRWMMALLAVGTNEYFSVSSVEICRKGESYTRDTILDLRGIYGENGEFYFITGADAIAEISTWHRTDNLPWMAKFIAVSRPGYKLDLKKIDPRFHRCTHLVEVPALAISSTEIRARIKNGKTIKYLVPETVEQYIRRKGLYQ